MQRKTETDYAALAKQAGYEWVGPDLPESVLEPTVWKCNHGHQFRMRYANLYSGRRCPICSLRWRRRLEDYRRMGTSHGLTFVGKTVPTNTRETTYWLHPEGIVLKLSYRSLAVRIGRVGEKDKDELSKLIAVNPDVHLEGENW